MTGTDYQGRPRGLARGNAAPGLIEMATRPFSVRSKITQRHEALNHGLRRHKLRPSAKNVVSKPPKSFSVPLREKKFKKGNRPDMFASQRLAMGRLGVRFSRRCNYVTRKDSR